MLRDFNAMIENRWDSIAELSETHKLVNVFADRLEGIE